MEGLEHFSKAYKETDKPSFNNRNNYCGKEETDKGKSGLNGVGLYDNIIKLAEPMGKSKVYNIKNESGNGKLSAYTIFPGIELIYTDMYLEYCDKNQIPIKDAIEINHCKEGRYECSYTNRECCYISAGDFYIGSLNRKKTESSFPLNHYHGITIIIKLDEISDELSNVLESLSIDLYNIKSFICDNNQYCIMRANESIEHIFSELYYVREKRRAGYMKIKVLELLLFLSDLDTTNDVVHRKYYSQNQVRVVKEVKKFIEKDISRHYTIEELARIFYVSSSTLKVCFKGVYGTSIYSYLKIYRLQKAQKLLSESDMSITQIAEDIGYGNPNKFTSAFKKEYGVSPSEYRKNIFLDRKNIH